MREPKKRNRKIGCEIFNCFNETVDFHYFTAEKRTKQKITEKIYRKNNVGRGNLFLLL